MSTADDTDQVLDLDEPADALEILLSLLHSPPSLPLHIKEPASNKYASTIFWPRFESGSVIPFPLLPRMIELADKYALPESLSQALLAHISAHASAYPLQIYSFAVERGLDSLAVEASKYLLAPSLSAYSPTNIKTIPTPEAWHRLVLLHDIRIRGLTHILLGEEIFPHGYGTCSTHKDRVLSLWNQKKMDIVLKIEAGALLEE